MLKNYYKLFIRLFTLLALILGVRFSVTSSSAASVPNVRSYLCDSTGKEVTNACRGFHK